MKISLSREHLRNMKILTEKVTCQKLIKKLSIKIRHQLKLYNTMIDNYMFGIVEHLDVKFVLLKLRNA